LELSKIDSFKKLRKLMAVDGLGVMKILKLIELFGSIENIFTENYYSLKHSNTLTKYLISKIEQARSYNPEFEAMLNSEIERLTKIRANIILYGEQEYPEKLKNIYYPPLILYVLGKLSNDDSKSISVVGTRNPSDYGRSVTSQIVKSLVKNNITIVSGLARGIDSIAHKTALKNKGRTIAIIGSGLDIIYPPENKNIFSDIIKNGAVISEFPLGTKPDARNFPKRNRIISGISLGTLVIETRLNGGAMQTAKHALDQNREVFAIPGNLFSEQSIGTNSLIKKNGAKLVQNEEDILNELNLKTKVKHTNQKQNINLSIFEQKIFDALSTEPIHIDKVAEKTGLSVSDCLISLLSLEFMEIVQQLPGKMFNKSPYKYE
jgi:DNA processing protein